jgi:hypothetical protein
MNILSSLDALQVGSTITYLLRASQLPVKPDRHWHGRVEVVSRPTANAAEGGCWVEVVDEGYEGMKDYVLFNQIREVY